MKKYILLLSLILGSIISGAQTWVPVGNTLQRSVDGTGFKYRFSLGSPGFYNISDSIRNALTFSNGLTKTGNSVKLGGNYTGQFYIGDYTDVSKFSVGGIDIGGGNVLASSGFGIVGSIPLSSGFTAVSGASQLSAVMGTQSGDINTLKTFAISDVSGKMVITDRRDNKGIEGDKLFSYNPDTDSLKYAQWGNINTVSVKKIQKVVYADDYTDNFTGFDGTTGRNNGSAVWQALVYLNSIGGGKLILSEKSYEPVGSDFFHPISFVNIEIEGQKMPYFNSNGTGLINGSIIKGSLVFIQNGGQSMRAKNFGIDVGKTVCDTYFSSVAQEGLIWCKPISHDPSTPYTRNAFAENITVVCYDSNSLVHAFLAEGIDGGVFNNILTMYGYHGIVNKSKHTFWDNLRAYFSGGENFIIKSDDYAISFDVNVGKVLVSHSENPTGVTPWSTPVGLYGVYIQSSTSYVNTVNIESITAFGLSNMHGLSFSSTIALVDVNIDKLNTYSFGTSVSYEGGGELSRTNIKTLLALNTASNILYLSGTNMLSQSNVVQEITTANIASPTTFGVYTSDSSSGDVVIGFANWLQIGTAYRISSGFNAMIREDRQGWVTKKEIGSKDPAYGYFQNTLQNLSVLNPVIAPNATLSTHLATLGQIQSGFVTTNTSQNITSVKTFTEGAVFNSTSTNNAINASVTTGLNAVNATSTAGAAIHGTATTGTAGLFQSASTGSGSTLVVDNSSTGLIATFGQSGTVKVSIANNGGISTPINNGGANDLVRNTDLQAGNTVSSASTLSLVNGGYYTFSGTTSIWTLPAIAGNIGKRFLIMNQGTGMITVNTAAGGNDIYNGANINVITINSGEIAVLYNNGISWFKQL